MDYLGTDFSKAMELESSANMFDLFSNSKNYEYVSKLLSKPIPEVVRFENILNFRNILKAEKVDHIFSDWDNVMNYRRNLK